MTPSPYIFGIRHHGPGSARSLRAALQQLQPDCVLVEGPPDADALIPLLAHPNMQPPVALLLYMPDQPRQAVYYPFALFSPEWQALSYALAQGITARFMDLPQACQLGEMRQGIEDEDKPSQHDDIGENHESSNPQPLTPNPRADPLGWLAQAAGYSDGERWWEQMVEHRRDGSEIFAAILEAMAALRAELPPDPHPREAQREAYMRQSIRAAQAEGYQRIAVVCGAWHAPALTDLAGTKADTTLLKGLPKVKLQATWVPWTHGRLAYGSGYGAGIESPGWYEHLWHATSAGYTPTEVAARWLVRVARLLREQDFDVSSAHVIEAVRLAEALAALRDRPLPGLAELNEAVQAVFCGGSVLPMRLVHEQLIVGETLGAVPAETPLAPLQQDLAREQKRLRLPASASWRDYDLDLRKPTDLERSHLLHRLNLLAIPWGKLQRSNGGKGTFHELWRVQWQPELAVTLIEAGIWGNTIADAATARACADAETAADLPVLTRLVDQVLLADLPAAIDAVMARLHDRAALASDVGVLMEALPPLANVQRYGNVRRTDTAAVAHVIDGLVLRIGVGLPAACAALDDDAAQAMFERVLAVNSALALLQHTDYTATWQAVLQRVCDLRVVHGLVGGRACRILLDTGALSADEGARRLSLALSAASGPPEAAAWIEGLLRDSGALLLHDTLLWQIIDGWLHDLPAALFLPTLPLLRRTFATFQPAERRMLGERARTGAATLSVSERANQRFDVARAKATLPLLTQLMGLQVIEENV
ncbi:MAG: hypothetical protein JST60_18445 [Chloroflexi bacterium SZAS-1]|nr:hypothetical protein [Chloroflexi bacterium SZAS-1]